MSRIASRPVRPVRGSIPNTGQRNGRFTLPIGNPYVKLNRPTTRPPAFTPDTRIGLMPGVNDQARPFMSRESIVVVEKAGVVVRIVPGLTSDEAAAYIGEFNRLNAHLGLTARLSAKSSR
jgi:hypothetical protein